MIVRFIDPISDFINNLYIHSNFLIRENIVRYGNDSRIFPSQLFVDELNYKRTVLMNRSTKNYDDAQYASN